MKVKARITLIVNGKSHLPPAVVDIAEDEAQRLIARGFAEAYQKETPASPVSKQADNKPDPTLEDIVEAIAALDPMKDYGKNGKPNVEAIEDLLDANITAAQRDHAWEVFQKETSDDDGKDV